MKYSINVARGIHEGGTKFYDIWGLIAKTEWTAETRIVLIQNWGKISSARSGEIQPLPGQYKINHFDNSTGADIFYKTIKANKEIRGYEFDDSLVLYDCNNVLEFWDKILDLKIDKSYHEDIYRHLFANVLPATPEIKPQTNTSSTTFKDKSINDPLWGIW